MLSLTDVPRNYTELQKHSNFRPSASRLLLQELAPPPKSISSALLTGKRVIRFATFSTFHLLEAYTAESNFGNSYASSPAAYLGYYCRLTLAISSAVPPEHANEVTGTKIKAVFKR